MKSVSKQPFTTVTFPSKDGLTITADFYPVAKPKGFILLCHRSHFNRGEYRESAPLLQATGFACLAIDQRSGMNVLGVINETSTLAKRKKLPTGYLDARQDIEAAIDYLYKKSRKPIILVGSSYSASLALLIGKENDHVKSVIAFSPGEYLKGIRVTESLKGFTKMLYVTSSKQEIAEVGNLVKSIGAKYKIQFKPKTEGAHGARVLWSKTEGHQEYRKSIQTFLQKT